MKLIKDQESHYLVVGTVDTKVLRKAEHVTGQAGRIFDQNT